MAVTTPCACLRASCQVRRRLGAGELWVWHFPKKPVDEEMETAGRPKFLGNPDVLMPCSLTPAGPKPSGHCDGSARPPLIPRRRLPREVISGLNGTASALAVYASSPGLPAADARLTSGCGPGSTRRDCLPAGFLRKVSGQLPTFLPPFPSLLGAGNDPRNDPFYFYATSSEFRRTSPGPVRLKECKANVQPLLCRPKTGP